MAPVRYPKCKRYEITLKKSVFMGNLPVLQSFVDALLLKQSDFHDNKWR